MRCAGILTSGVVTLILLAVVYITRHLSSPPRPTVMVSATFHASFERGHLVFMRDIKQAFSETITSNC
ncbi:MAG: hypothetical protein OJF50_001652 [Nitrospira sp.]|nr:hypothetical protein [Nitrospira sp.]